MQLDSISDRGKVQAHTSIVMAADINEEMNKHNGVGRCHYCGSEDGKLRMIGGYIVELSPVKVRGENKKACQSCLMKHWELRKKFSEFEKDDQKDQKQYKRHLFKKFSGFGF